MQVWVRGTGSAAQLLEPFPPHSAGTSPLGLGPRRQRLSGPPTWLSLATGMGSLSCHPPTVPLWRPFPTCSPTSARRSPSLRTVPSSDLRRHQRRARVPSHREVSLRLKGFSWGSRPLHRSALLGHPLEVLAGAGGGGQAGCSRLGCGDECHPTPPWPQAPPRLTGAFPSAPSSPAECPCSFL